MSLSNIRIVHKILIIVGLLSAILIYVGYAGYHSAVTLGMAGQDIDDADGQALRASRMNNTLLALNRSQYRMGLDASQESMATVEKSVAESRALFERSLDDLRSSADPQEQEMLRGVADGYAAFMTSLETTMQKARALGGGCRRRTRWPSSPRSRKAEPWSISCSSGSGRWRNIMTRRARTWRTGARSWPTMPSAPC
ncbi:MCP four helix bundle domain-containing protein [Nitrospirillum viridazoti]|uniref:MCP four helix bundle domain-containing protein n=1 Tax=Nitrospirillum viridazoti TaxID=3144925 RepID=UPI00110FBCA1|nr:MCP four helix bundle domain-containing protein [Nitrospirillum amazonense]